MLKQHLLAAVATACLGSAALAPGAQAEVIRYQLNNVSATGPWDTYHNPLTLYWYANQAFSPTAYFELNTTTNVVGIVHHDHTNVASFFESFAQDGTNHFGPNTQGAYNPTNHTVSYGGGYDTQVLTFSADLAVAGPASLTSVARIDCCATHGSTAVTGGVTVATIFGAPEPASLALLGAGLLGPAILRRVRAGRQDRPAGVLAA